MASRSDNIIKFPQESVGDIESEAAGWLVRVTSGSLTLGELVEFEYWRGATPEHDRVYREIEAMWDGLSTGAAPGRRERFLSGMRRSQGRSGWGIRFGQIAAAIAVIVMASQYLSVWRYDYHTAPGEIRRLNLADGSTLYMKGGTALNVNVSTTGPRIVELARGEAFFDVRHDAARPFLVDIGSGTVRDVGTGFSISRTGQSATVAVEHGAVAVAAGGLSDLLTRGQQVSFNLYDMSNKVPVDPGEISAWRRGLYVAEGKPLGEVLADLGEYYPRRIIVLSNTLAARRVNAVVQLSHIDAWLDALGETRGVSVRQRGPFTVVGDREN